MARGSIKKPEDLKGKKIGSDRYGSLSDLVLREALRHYNIVPEDCIHGIHPQSQPFALHQFRSNAYNYNVTVSRSEDLQLISEGVALERAVSR